MPKKDCPFEDFEQARLVTWMTRQGIRFYAVPNSGKRSFSYAIKLKSTGLVPGVPDICIPIPSGEWHGLYIELKRQHGGVLSDPQREWLDYLNKQNYYASVANGFEEAKNIILKYLSFMPKAS